MTSLIPFDFLKAVAAEHGLSDAEFEALSLALEGYSTTDIATQLDLSAIAIRKRLGEVYKKFQISGSGPGKLADLKHQLLLEFQSHPTTPTLEAKHPRQHSQIDWGEAPDVPVFFGRTEELTQLQQWITHNHTRVVTVVGMGKVGKTALAVKLIEQIHSDFERVIWRSLRYAPPLEELLGELIGSLSGSSKLPPGTGKQIFRLVECFRGSRCLVVLDELESLFQPQELAGTYRPGYESYGELLRQVGELAHRSCLMVLSREEPLEIAVQAGTTQPVKVWRLGGLSEAEGQPLLHSLLGKASVENEKVIELIRDCGGNPLLLRLVTQKIQELFNGNLDRFFEHHQLFYGNFQKLGWMGELLNLVFREQVERLSAGEIQVLNRLVLSDETVSLTQLQSHVQVFGDRTKLLNTLASLHRRSLLQQISELEEVKFSLNPMIRQYMRQHLIETICTLITHNPDQSLEELGCLGVLGLEKIHTQEEEKDFKKNAYERVGRFLNQIGYQQYMKGELISAKLYLSWALQFHPNLAPAHFNLGSTYEKLQDLESAQIHYERATETEVKKAKYSALNNLARLQILEGNYQAAIELIEPILPEVQDNGILTSLYKNLGWAYFHKNLYTQAEKFLVEALELNESCTAAYLLLAQVKVAQGKKRQALVYWEEGLNSQVEEGGFSHEPWKWPEIEIWKGEARRYLQMGK
ncbi:NB-ARC domain-containing protein [Planktothrix tepida]|uniref:NB-ARC domain-containing protein n=1 Tax=Planktothrix tepida TaxID=1678309 RepID=UPI000933E254|nr:NB-ARC domain-containing protein [Planktothrix tepida]